MKRITISMFNEMCLSLEKAIAMYDLLHMHARGQTDLTEDQLANVVTGISLEARDVLRRVQGGRQQITRAWVPEAIAAVALPVRRLNA